MKWVSVALTALLLGATPWMGMAADGAESAPGTANPQPRVVLETTEGSIVIELDREHAPLSVDNFLAYVADDHYNGTIFHRVIDGFMIQGGGYTEDFERKATRDPITNEADNGLHNTTGTIAMARTSDPHSATAQFYININDNGFLDHQDKTPTGWGYTVFGRVVDGMETVDRIRALPTGHGGPFPKDVPQTPVVIERVTVVPAAAPAEPTDAATNPATATPLTDEAAN